MTSESDLFERLASIHPDLRALRDAHVAEYSELLGHVLITDVQSWLLARLATDRQTVRRVLDVLDSHVGPCDDPVTNLIVVSFLEGLGRDPSRPDELALRAALPGRLLGALREVEAWRPY